MPGAAGSLIGIVSGFSVRMNSGVSTRNEKSVAQAGAGFQPAVLRHHRTGTLD
jgi:hypothetical protein